MILSPSTTVQNTLMPGLKFSNEAFITAEFWVKMGYLGVK